MLNIKTYDPRYDLPDPHRRIIFRISEPNKRRACTWYTGRFDYDWVTDESYFYKDDCEGYATKGYYTASSVTEWGYIE